MNLQSRLQYRNARLKIKLFDNKVRKKALDVRVIRVNITEDKFENQDFEVIDHGTIDIIIKIPGNDLQAFQGQRTNNDTYNNGLSVYSILPIQAWTTSDANLSIKDILLFKILTKPYDDDSTETQIQALQVASSAGKVTTTKLYNVWNVAPYSFNRDEYSNIETIINNYKIEPIVLY